LKSFSLSIGTKIKIDQFGLIEGSLRNRKDGITYFGYNGVSTSNNIYNINNINNINNEIEEENSLDYVLPIKHCDNPGRFFKIQYIKKLNEYILKHLEKGFGTFIKIEDSMYLRNKSIINIGDVYLAIFFCEKNPDIKDIYGFNCDLKIKVYNNNNKEYFFEKENEKDIKIGRGNFGNDIELNDNLISKINCVIRYNNIKGWMIKDGSDSILKNGEIKRNFSKNGTWILINDNIKITDNMIFKSNFNIFKCNFIPE